MAAALTADAAVSAVQSLKKFIHSRPNPPAFLFTNSNFSDTILAWLKGSQFQEAQGVVLHEMAASLGSVTRLMSDISSFLVQRGIFPLISNLVTFPLTELGSESFRIVLNILADTPSVTSDVRAKFPLRTIFSLMLPSKCYTNLDCVSIKGFVPLAAYYAIQCITPMMSEEDQTIAFIIFSIACKFDLTSSIMYGLKGFIALGESNNLPVGSEILEIAPDFLDIAKAISKPEIVALSCRAFSSFIISGIASIPVMMRDLIDICSTSLGTKSDIDTFECLYNVVTSYMGDEIFEFVEFGGLQLLVNVILAEKYEVLVEASKILYNVVIGSGSDVLGSFVGISFFSAVQRLLEAEDEASREMVSESVKLLIARAKSSADGEEFLAEAEQSAVLFEAEDNCLQL